ncbi:hypothetical protein [Scleromatobacter humisilvae]|uniref:Antitoxin Xre/MbcA/ParS-like toxin-binding domain-containing protein n=1 Tax=Scleromatobacter humisilvae TaxID=2897159 RepID=A0A9X1YPM4_9BURK|nr:hypothetical protein [Scleromatobacter humisilvae]MCK9689460.1 hypothetical protein [Scleromatobacter humisilvae]
MPQTAILLAAGSRISPAKKTSPTARIAPAFAEATRGSWGQPFGEIEVAYRRSGGLASDADVVSMLRQASDQPMSRLARWIVARDVVSFEYRGTIWLPLFQFEPGAPSLLPAVTAVIRELVDVFDDWELATWFALPNTWLQGRTPVDAIAAHSSAALEAARADRFIARG